MDEMERGIFSNTKLVDMEGAIELVKNNTILEVFIDEHDKTKIRCNQKLIERYDSDEWKYLINKIDDLHQ